MRIAVGVLGPGRVGKVLLDQIRAASPHLARNVGLEIVLTAVASSRVMRVADGAEQPTDLGAFIGHLCQPATHGAVVVDCTASADLPDHYAAWLTQGIHVVTPNKHAGSGPLSRWKAIGEAAHARGSRYLHEATVCAGLPVLHTLKDLLRTGDELIAVHGLFSGTLAWIFNQYNGERPFSVLVREAHALGYTEPDPRQDLSGADVARKLVILAREAGRSLSLDDVQVQSLVPPELAELPLDAFMRRLPELDASMAARLAQARLDGRILRHVATLPPSGPASVGISGLAPGHAFAHSHLTDNVVQFVTQRYRDTPLQVQGPGAGPDVTAGGIFGDLLRVAESLGARMDFQRAAETGDSQVIYAT